MMSLLFGSPEPPPWSACGGQCTPLGGMMSLGGPLTKVNGPPCAKLFVMAQKIFMVNIIVYYGQDNLVSGSTIG